MTKRKNQTIEALWAKRAAGEVIYLVDLFCGAGGFTHGALQVPGVKLAVAIENSTVEGYAKAWLHEKHHPGLHVCMRLGEHNEKKLTRVIDENVPEGARLHIHGSPPCQGFTLMISASSKAIYDAEHNEKRRSLSGWFIDFCARAKDIFPNRRVTCTYENVTGAMNTENTAGLQNALIMKHDDYGGGTVRRRVFGSFGFDIRKVVDERPPEREMAVYDPNTGTTKTFKTRGRTVREITGLPPTVYLHDRQSFGRDKTRQQRSVLRPMHCITGRALIRKYVWDENAPNDATWGRWVNIKDKLTLRQMAAIQGFPERYFDPVETLGAVSTFCIQCLSDAVCPEVARAVMRCVSKANI